MRPFQTERGAMQVGEVEVVGPCRVCRNCEPIPSWGEQPRSRNRIGSRVSVRCIGAWWTCWLRRIVLAVATCDGRYGEVGFVREIEDAKLAVRGVLLIGGHISHTGETLLALRPGQQFRAVTVRRVRCNLWEMFSCVELHQTIRQLCR